MQIHLLDGPSCPADPLEPGEYLDFKDCDFPPGNHPIRFSGFPSYDQNIDHEKREVSGIGWTIEGHVEATSDDKTHRFHSDSLKGKNANGYSGGLVTCDVSGNLYLVGMCLLGDHSGKLDHIALLGIEVLADQLSKAYNQLTSPQ